MQQRAAEELMDVPIPQTQEQIDEVAKGISSERVLGHIVEQIEVVPVPEITRKWRM